MHAPKRSVCVRAGPPPYLIINRKPNKMLTIRYLSRPVCLEDDIEPKQRASAAYRAQSPSNNVYDSQVPSAFQYYGPHLRQYDCNFWTKCSYCTTRSTHVNKEKDGRDWKITMLRLSGWQRHATVRGIEEMSSLVLLDGMERVRMLKLNLSKAPAM